MMTTEQAIRFYSDALSQACGSAEYERITMILSALRQKQKTEE